MSKTNRGNPVSRREVLCTETITSNGCCVACRRYLKRRVPHKPESTGSLGWIETYADGTTRIVPR